LKKSHFAAFAVSLILLALPVLIARQKSAAPVLSPEDQVEDARDFFFNLLSSKIDDYWHRGDYDNAVRLLRAQIEMDPNWVEAYSSAAWLLWSKKQFGAAKKLYQEGIAKNPEDYHLYFELGRMYVRTAQPGSLYKKTPAEARRLYQQALTPLSQATKYGAPPEVHRLLAHIYHKLGRYREERKVLEQVLQNNPTDAVALKALANLKKLK
jgi:tetratricopeptide (TPR) repeat protein